MLQHGQSREWKQNGMKKKHKNNETCLKWEAAYKSCFDCRWDLSKFCLIRRVKIACAAVKYRKWLVNASQPAQHNTTAIVPMPISIILKQEDGTNVNSQIDSSRSKSGRAVAANNRDKEEEEEEDERKNYICMAWDRLMSLYARWTEVHQNCCEHEPPPFNHLVWICFFRGLSMAMKLNEMK